MQTTTYQDINPFLARVQSCLEADEAANSLMLGVSLQVKETPDRYKTPPCLKTVDDGDELLLIAVVTPPFNLIIFSPNSAPSGAYELLIRDLVAGGWDVPGVIGPATAATEFARAWETITRGEFTLRTRQGAYELRQVTQPGDTMGDIRLAVEDDTETVVKWTHAFQYEIFGDDDLEAARRGSEMKLKAGDVFLWVVDGQPVSIAARTRPTRNGISIGLVYTPAAYRRRGYASACVARLSQSLLDQGYQFCALFTDLDNPTSNHIYQEIGYRYLCDYFEYRFQPRR